MQGTRHSKVRSALQGRDGPAIDESESTRTADPDDENAGTRCAIPSLWEKGLFWVDDQLLSTLTATVAGGYNILLEWSGTACAHVVTTRRQHLCRICSTSHTHTTFTQRCILGGRLYILYHSTIGALH